jgi:hypothetical protein
MISKPQLFFVFSGWFCVIFDLIPYMYCWHFFWYSIVKCLGSFCTATCSVSGYPRQVIEVDAARTTMLYLDSIITGLSTQQISNKQIKYYINIRLFVHFATCFNPACSSSGKYSWNVHLYWIVLLIWIHIRGDKYKFNYDSSLNISLKI